MRVGMPSPARMEVRTPAPAMERRPQNTPWMSGEMTCGVSDHWLVVQRKLGRSDALWGLQHKPQLSRIMRS